MTGSSPADAAGKPRTRQRAYKPPPELPVPDIDEDAAERKRVLNVLAQRRYREKRRHNRLKKSKAAERQDETEPSGSGPSETHEDDSEVIEMPSRQDSSTEAMSGLDSLSLDAWDSLDDPALSYVMTGSGTMSDFLSGISGYTPFLHPATATTTAIEAPTACMSDIMTFDSPSSVGSSPLGTSSTSPPSEWDFPDSYLLPVHELTLLRAMLRIAHRLGCTDEQLWSHDGISPFHRGVAPPASHLPPTWQPTLQQVMVPHHPLLDFMPWPSVRDRLIGIMSLPDGARPPAAAGPLALANLAYDFEHSAEGVRIYGADPYDPDYWEVGQVFFERWWFLFDRDIVDTSNRWRLLRGAPPLLMKAAASPAPSGPNTSASV